MDKCPKCGKKGVTERYHDDKVIKRCRYCKDCTTINIVYVWDRKIK